MTLTVRLTPHLRQQLERYCRRRRLTKTQLVTELLEERLSAPAGQGKTPYQIARDFGLIGGFASGKGDLARNRKRYLAEKLRAKRPR
ncbi:MAG: CopG family transcriptional regulator [Betaproteobacteria bacterium]|nr:CopG family transcriptional regulator [Betaproteobacteria bacterium]